MTTLASASTQWGVDKTDLSLWLGVGDDGLHVLVGMGLLLALALITGRRLDDGWLWLTVLVAECANEAVDLSAPDLAEGTWGGSLHDLILTMILPTALLLLLRFTGWRARQAAARATCANEANSARPSVDG